VEVPDLLYSGQSTAYRQGKIAIKVENLEASSRDLGSSETPFREETDLSSALIVTKF
jgi:hypothetical protein